MSAAYPIAAHPEPYQILGLRLQPFCLGHCEHMERHGVVFASGEVADATLADLFLGIFICSQTYEGFSEFINQPDWKEQVTEWSKSCGKFDIAEKAELFLRYVRDGSVQPIVIFENDGKPSGAHWIQCVKIALIELGYERLDVMNMPLSQAFADYYKHAENKGVVRLASPAEAAGIAALEQQEATCPAS